MFPNLILPHWGSVFFAPDFPSGLGDLGLSVKNKAKMASSISAFSSSSTPVKQQAHIFPSCLFAADGPALAFLTLSLYTQILS